MKHGNSIWIGYDQREANAFAVARGSIERHTILPYPIRGLMLDQLQRDGLYTRPTTRTDSGQLWDEISQAPMATEFACSRFLVPSLACGGWALFVDCDVMARRNMDALFRLCDPSKAVMVVQHDHQPQGGVKMDGQIQTIYARKNWSSVCAFNCDHPSNKALTFDLVNSVPGRDLHRFCWLKDEEIGALPPAWNWLVGHSDPAVDPSMVHFTDGIPTMPGYENCAFADEWRSELRRWVF